MEFVCGRCSESLDDRDVQKEVLTCWKCGWKETRLNVKKGKADDISEWVEKYLSAIDYPTD